MDKHFSAESARTEKDVSPPQPDKLPDRLLVPYYRSYLFLFENRPLAKALLTKYIPAILCGYSALVATAVILQWTWLDTWVQFSRPAVETLRLFLPIFDNVARQVGLHSAEVQHLLAFGDVVGTPLFIFLLVTVWRLPHHEWLRFIKVVPQYIFYWALVGNLIFFLFGIYWVAWWGAANRLYYDWFSLFKIGVMFTAVIGAGLGSEISLCGIIEGDKFQEDRKLQRV